MNIHERIGQSGANADLGGKVALVAMPWFWAHMPSIQLAIVKDELSKSGYDTDVFEFYADFADLFGVDLYGKIANTGTFLGERLFSQFYFDDLQAQSGADVPHLLFDAPNIEEHIFDFATPLVDQFLDQCVEEADWGSYTAVCLTLTAQQLGASIAFARRLRARHPHVPIVVGGAACADEMGCATLELCPEIDIAVHGEAEIVVPRLFAALTDATTLAEVGGISWRDGHGTIVTNPAVPVHAFSKPRGPLNFDSYFKRVERLPDLNALPIWVPFESSRGCWYGEKSQCTFCGLNEIIKFRERDSSALFEELSWYEHRYKRKHFFSVDLIMPLSFFDDFLPRVSGSDKDWIIFYEVKSNMRRDQIDLLATAGVRWIQPGVESLNDHVLKLMRKGVSAAHNIQTLRYSAERDITVSWNLISDFPKETPDDYLQMARFFPRLHHLDPPSGIGAFEVHRFSPFHDQPEEHGVRLCGPHRTYEAVFPVDRDLLQRLVYRFDYDLIEPSLPTLVAAHQQVDLAINAWKRARGRHARFDLEIASDGSAILTDTRQSDTAMIRKLLPEQVVFLRFIEEMRPAVRLADDFAKAHPDVFVRLGGDAGLAELLDDWQVSGVILGVSGMVLSLPVNRTASAPGRAESLAGARELAV